MVLPLVQVLSVHSETQIQEQLKGAEATADKNAEDASKKGTVQTSCHLYSMMNLSIIAEEFHEA